MSSEILSLEVRRNNLSLHHVNYYQLLNRLEDHLNGHRHSPPKIMINTRIVQYDLLTHQASQGSNCFDEEPSSTRLISSFPQAEQQLPKSKNKKNFEIQF